LVGIFALAFILFAGGLDTDWRTVRPVLPRAVLLATAGVAVTAGILGLFAWRVLGLSPLEGMLLGATVSSTDAAAVFAIMRARGVGLKGNLKPLLELESGSNDPMAVFLTVGVLNLLVNPGEPWYSLVPELIVRMAMGVAVGFVLGRASARLFNRLRLEYEGLYPVLGMSLVLLSYGVSEVLRGNGFLSVYVCGIVLGNSDFLNKRALTRFHDGLSWLMQILLFLTLGLLVYPSRLLTVAGPALLAAACLIFVARPVAVYLGLLGSRFSFREQTLVAWTGLRGAVPIVLATYPFMAGYEHSERLFHMVFFIVLTSVLLQGKTLMLVARLLGVDEPLRARPRSPIAFEKRAGCVNETREVDVPPESVAVGRAVAELGLPPAVLILLIRRGPGFVVPRGQTRLEAFDTLTLLAGPADLAAAQDVLLAPRRDDDPPAVGDDPSAVRG
jgi:cell volume regulation protein A